jgi:putative transposase
MINLTRITRIMTGMFDGSWVDKGTPTSPPWANCAASLRECLDRLLTVNQRHPRFVLEQYVEHYNSHRQHRSLAQRSPDRRHDAERPANVQSLHLVQRQGVVGGLINEYNHAA